MDSLHELSKYVVEQGSRAKAPARVDAKAAWKLAKDGDREGYVRLGLHYAEGNGIKQDVEFARVLFKTAAMAGSASACLHLGLLYQHGKSVTHDQAVANYWFSKALLLGIPSLAHTVFEKLPVNDPDYQRFNHLYDQAVCYFNQAKAEQEQELLDYGILGRRPLNVQSDVFVHQVDWHTIFKACFDLGVMYRHGTYVSQSDEQMFTYLKGVYSEASLKSGLLLDIAGMAALEIGDALEKEVFILKSVAIDWYMCASTCENAEASYRLAFLPNQATHITDAVWKELHLKKADQFGHPKALLELYVHYKKINKSGTNIVQDCFIRLNQKGRENPEVAFQLFKYYDAMFFPDADEKRLAKAWLSLAQANGHQEATETW